MKTFILPFIAVLCFMLTSQNLQAQDSTKVDPTLSGQYKLMLSKSKNLNGFKLISPARLSSFWKSVRDTLNAERKELYDVRAKINAHQKTVVDLKESIDSKETALNTSNAKLNEITFMGIAFSKSSYNSIVWTIIIILALALAVLIFRSRKLLYEAKYRSGLYNEVSEEYQKYKVKTNEKEKKLARELQDERNKFEEYRSTGRY